MSMVMKCPLCQEPYKSHRLLAQPISPFDWHAVFTLIVPSDEFNLVPRQRQPQRSKLKPLAPPEAVRVKRLEK